MAQYFLLVNLDKKEYVDPLKLGGGLTLWEWCTGDQARIISWLLAKGPQDGTYLPFASKEFAEAMDRYIHGKDDSALKIVGEIASTRIGEGKYKTVGRWAGDRIVLVGDYDDSGLYDIVEMRFKDISEEVVKEYTDSLKKIQERTNSPP